MKVETAKALRAELEKRDAFNALPEDAPAEEIEKLRVEHRVASEKLLDLLKAEENVIEVPGELTHRVECREYMDAFIRGEKVTGAAAELNAEMKLDDVTQMPLAALVPTGDLEKRADVPTQTADLPANSSLHMIIARVFQNSLAGRLGMMMPGVSPGQQDYPVLTGGTTAAGRKETKAIEAAKATFSTVSINPTRISARYQFTLEDVARLGSMVEDTLRSDIRAVLNDQIDEEVILGDGSSTTNGKRLTGLVKTLDSAFTADPSKATNFAKDDDLDWAGYRSLVLDGLDGVYADTEAAIRIALGLNLYKTGRAKFRSDNAESSDAIQAMRALGAMVTQSKRLAVEGEATNSGDSKTADITQDLIIRTAEPEMAIAPMWGSVQMIRDPYTDAAKGMVALTVHHLCGFGLKRADAWNLQKKVTSIGAYSS